MARDPLADMAGAANDPHHIAQTPQGRLVQQIHADAARANRPSTPASPVSSGGGSGEPFLPIVDELFDLIPTPVHWLALIAAYGSTVGYAIHTGIETGPALALGLAGAFALALAFVLLKLVIKLVIALAMVGAVVAVIGGALYVLSGFDWDFGETARPPVQTPLYQQRVLDLYWGAIKGQPSGQLEADLTYLMHHGQQILECTYGPVYADSGKGLAGHLFWYQAVPSHLAVLAARDDGGHLDLLGALAVDSCPENRAAARRMRQSSKAALRRLDAP